MSLTIIAFVVSEFSWRLGGTEMKITNEEAIKMLKEFAIVDAIQEDYDVIDMAIEALEKRYHKRQCMGTAHMQIGENVGFVVVK